MGGNVMNAQMLHDITTKWWQRLFPKYFTFLLLSGRTWRFIYSLK